MGFWEFDKEDTKVCLDHLGDKVPDSIREEAKQELRRRGWSEDDIREEEWKRMD